MRRPSAAFIPPGTLEGMFVRVEGPVPLAVLKRLQTGYPKAGPRSRRTFHAPIFLGCGGGTYIATDPGEVFPARHAPRP